MMANNPNRSAFSSSSDESIPQLYKNTTDSDENDVERVIEKRINQIYKRLKETDSNLKAMEKLMSKKQLETKSGRSSSTVDGDHRPISYQRLTQSMQDLYVTQPQMYQPPVSRVESEPPIQPNISPNELKLRIKLNNLESEQSKLQNTMENLSRNFEMASRQSRSPSVDLLVGEQLKSSVQQISKEFKRIAAEEKMIASDKERELKMKAKKTISSWKNKCESLLVDKNFLEDQVTKLRDQIQISIRERELLHLQLEEIHQKLKMDAHQREEFKAQLTACRDENIKKDDLIHKYKTLWSGSSEEISSLKFELEKVHKHYVEVLKEKTELVRVNSSLKHQEEEFQKSTTSQDEIIKKLKEEIGKIKAVAPDIKQEHTKLASDLESTIKNLEDENKSLELKNEKFSGETECLKAELSELKIKHDQVSKEYFKKCEECMSKVKRISKLQDTFKESCKTIEYKDQDFKMILASVSLEIDKVINVWNSLSNNSLPVQGLVIPITPTSSHAKIHWIDIQSKLKVLQQEIASWTKKTSSKSLNVAKETSDIDTAKINENLNVFSGKSHSSQMLNIDVKKKKKKVNSTKIKPGREMFTTSENISSHKLFHNSSISLSSINQSADSTDDPSTY